MRSKKYLVASMIILGCIGVACSLGVWLFNLVVLVATLGFAPGVSPQTMNWALLSFIVGGAVLVAGIVIWRNAVEPNNEVI